MGMQWYIIHTYSGFEKKVKESLESRVAAFNLQDKIGRVMIPMEEVIEVRGGKKVVSPRMSYPGYVLVEMDLDENTWHIVRSTPRVTGFVGSATSPSPLSDAEVDAIINRVHVPTDRPKPKVVFERNEQVRIVDGPFANFNGSVEEIDNDHSRLKVSVTIFGRSTPVELDFASVESWGKAAKRACGAVNERRMGTWQRRFKRPSSCNYPPGKPRPRRPWARRSARTV